MRFYWECWSDQKLLSLRLCDLGLKITETPLEDGLHILYEELFEQNLNFMPHAWISDEWFCHDGVPGIAVPFFLLHPRLIELERKMIGEAEGETFDGMMKLLRHEAGHAIDNAFVLRKSNKRIEVFGDFKQRYPASYRPKPYSRKYVRHLDSWYAQSHPDEDFAETFAVWLDPDSLWQKKYANWPALKKLEFMDNLMKGIQNKNPLLKNQREVDSIKNNKKTLRSYYFEKRRRLKISSHRKLDSELKRVFLNENSQQFSAALFLKSIKQNIRRKVAQGVGGHQYQVEPVINQLILRAKVLNLKIKQPNDQLEEIITDLVTDQVLHHLNTRRDHVIL